MKECFICGRCFGDHNLECDLDKTALNTTLLGLPLVKNRYRLDQRISTEPIGASYLAYDIESKCSITLKVILMEYLQSDFQKYSEVLEAIAQISHPNLISIFDYGKNDEAFFYIVVEHLEGKTLEQILEEQKYLPLEQAIHYINLLCEAVNAIYDAGQMYQDIRLANIFINNNDLKLCNLGLFPSFNVKLSEAMLELPYYMSPEQCNNFEVDERSEVYSIGILLYQLLTGNLPFSGQNYLAIAEQHIRQAPNNPCTLRPEIPSNVASIVLRALEKDPDRRFQSILAFASLLCQALRQINKIPSSRPIGVNKPSTEKMGIGQSKKLKEPKILKEQNKEQIIDNDDVNRTIEITRLAEVMKEEGLSITQSGIQFLEANPSLIKEETEDLFLDLVEIEQAPTRSKKPSIKRKPTINLAQDDDQATLKDIEELIDLTSNKVNLGASNDDILTSLSGKLAEKIYPLPLEIEDSTKPLPPELYALFNAQINEEKNNQEKLPSFNQREKISIKNSSIDVNIVKESLAKDSSSKDESIKNSPITLSPTQTSYFYADKLLAPYKSSQYQRKMHNNVVVQREALASLALVLAIFSLRRRKCLKVIPLSSIAPVLQKKLILDEDDKVVLQIINAGVKPLDGIEQAIFTSFGRSNAVSLYGLYQYFFLIADEQKIAIAELINDAIADDLTEKKLLKVIPRDTKTVLEPGGSVCSYSVEGIEMNSYLSLYDELLEFIEGLKKETLSITNASQIQVYTYMLGYYKNLFCQHSYTFER